MLSIERAGQRVHFEVSGAGPAVLLGHSYLCSGEMWRGQAPVLAERYRVVNVDFRGHGGSAPAAGPFGIYDLVDDLAAVLDELGIERAVWVGLSIGGMVAVRAALVRPERVAALVLMDSHAGAERPWIKVKYRLLGTLVRLFGVRPVVPAILPLMFGETSRRDRQPLVTEWADRMASSHVPSMLLGLDALVGRDSVSGRLGEVAAPALVVVGEEDRALPPALSRELAAGLAAGRLVTVPKAGHLSALEQPEAVNRALLEFLGALDLGN